MADRLKAPISFRFNTIRLNDLSDDYGFDEDFDLSIVDDEVVEEALDASSLQRKIDCVSNNRTTSSSAVPGNAFIVRQTAISLRTKMTIKNSALSMVIDGNASDTESQRTMDRSSLGSNELKETSGTSKFGAFIDKAKSKGRKIVSSRKDKERSRTPGVTETAAQCVIVNSQRPVKENNKDEAEDQFMTCSFVRRYRRIPLFQYRIMLLGILLSITFLSPGFFTGILWGLYISFVGFLYFFVSELPVKQPSSYLQARNLNILNEEPEVAVEATNDKGYGLGVSEAVIYKGWMNELRGKYSPATYHVNHAQSVLVRLENFFIKDLSDGRCNLIVDGIIFKGSTLRISRPAKAVLKHAFHEDPTLTQPQPTMISQTIYSLVNAHVCGQVSLRPKRLAKRRWWSRKYPIYIRFARKAGDIDLSRSFSRSVSMHPVETAPDCLPSLEGTFDEGYTAETDLSDESELDVSRIARANSLSDVGNLTSVSDSTSCSHKRRSIYLFVRAAREKERWFHLLREACAQSNIFVRSVTKRRNSDFHLALDECGLSTSCHLRSNNLFEDIVYKRLHAHFSVQISMALGCGVPQPERGSTVSVDLGTIKWKPSIPEENSDLVESINSLGTRIFFDFCRDEFWTNQVKHKIQSKLATIHLPYFIEKLELSSLSLGSTAPRIVGVYAPKLNEWGIWVDLEMKYSGGIRLVLQTSVNLLKLQSGAAKSDAERKLCRLANAVTRTSSHYSDEELPESPESSPDEDFGAKNICESTNSRGRTGKKIISIVERAAQSSLFQKAAKLPKFAKLIEDVSSTPLILNVVVEMLEGPITLNIPPPPSDRLWYAFRRPPLASIRAVPQVGDRSVDMSTVSDWIESKLRLLIEKNLVCPNMDDIVLPVMSGNDLLRNGAYNQ
ncbi:hypothetical protein DICVIV_06221 [Dictyocaulus viviparus]|uniref:SMP-LTD domain-containing protein n=1 Tax=Dictyocaulus viviparus TaxID=29172 RepID=A0A0D8XV65_DICVI|nr:hypothetical protein DICVIV_06221 [Dictyocaulus viviparus]